MPSLRALLTPTPCDFFYLKSHPLTSSQLPNFPRIPGIPSPKFLLVQFLTHPKQAGWRKVFRVCGFHTEQTPPHNAHLALTCSVPVNNAGQRHRLLSGQSSTLTPNSSPGEVAETAQHLSLTSYLSS